MCSLYKACVRGTPSSMPTANSQPPTPTHLNMADPELPAATRYITPHRQPTLAEPSAAHRRPLPIKTYVCSWTLSDSISLFAFLFTSHYLLTLVPFHSYIDQYLQRDPYPFLFGSPA